MHLEHWHYDITVEEPKKNIRAYYILRQLNQEAGVRFTCHPICIVWEFRILCRRTSNTTSGRVPTFEMAKGQKKNTHIFSSKKNIKCYVKINQI